MARVSSESDGSLSTGLTLAQWMQHTEHLGSFDVAEEELSVRFYGDEMVAVETLGAMLRREDELRLSDTVLRQYDAVDDAESCREKAAERTEELGPSVEIDQQIQQQVCSMH